LLESEGISGAGLERSEESTSAGGGGVRIALGSCCSSDEPNSTW